MNIEVFNHSSIKLSGKKNIYFDPYQIKREEHDADYIFITHDHYDHYEEESIKKVLNEKTYIIVPSCLKEQVMTITDNALVVEPNKTYSIDNLIFDTIHSYNNNKPFHPKDKNYVGYNLNVDDAKYYIMGDTDRTMATDSVTTDICLVPIGGTYTMNIEEAAAFVNYIKPKKVIPTHYGSLVGDISLSEDFKKLIDKKIEVEIKIR